VVVVPFNRVDSKVMVLVSLQVLARVCSRAQVNVTLFSTDQEHVLEVLTEVKAHTTGKTVHELLLLVGGKVLVVVDHKL